MLIGQIPDTSRSIGNHDHRLQPARKRHSGLRNKWQGSGGY
jgi:hypothetical protein